MGDPVISPDPDRVAVCLSCGNEWVVRTAGTGKKRKCPVCGRYRVKMKSEMISSGNGGGEAANKPMDENLPPAPPARVEVPAEDAKMEEEKKEKKEKKRKEKINRVSLHHPDEDEEEDEGDEDEDEDEEEEEDENPPAPVLTYVALLVLAVGAGWLIYSMLRRRRRYAPVPADYEDEVKPRRYAPFPGF